jgi:hypothetical protein
MIMGTDQITNEAIPGRIERYTPYMVVMVFFSFSFVIIPLGNESKNGRQLAEMLS